VQPPSVVIAANPYEAELCRRALVETGLQVVIADGGEGVLEQVRDVQPLVLVVALGSFHCDPLELVVQARAQHPTLPIFLIGDREGEVPDEEAAARLGATRLFLRPIDIESLADAIEKRAVEAEIHDDVSEAIREFSVRPPTIDAAPLVEEAIVELEAEYEDQSAQPLARIALRRVPREPTQVLRGTAAERPSEPVRGVADVRDLPSPRELDAIEQAPQRTAVAESLPTLDVELAPPTASAPEPLLRADEALADVGLHALVGTPDFVHRPAAERPRPVVAVIPAASERDAVEPRRAVAPGDEDEPRPLTAERGRAGFDERGSFARQLESELSAAERRLFPDSPSTASARSDEYEDALGDIDLDALGIDTIPGIGGDFGDHLFDLRPRNGHGEPVMPQLHERRGNGKTEPYVARTEVAAPRLDELAERLAPRPSLPDEEGDLAATDVALLLAQLHRAGFSGTITLSRGDGDKTLFFDDGEPVGARSSFAHDRLVDLLLREGSITRDAHQRLRELPDGGRRAGLQLVERGVLKSSELFVTLRHHVDEIWYSCFAWERGLFRLGREQPAPEDRVRMGAHPLALVLEGVRRKYSLERLVEQVGPAETVLTPTGSFVRALDECALTPAERAVAELIDGDRALAQLMLSTGTPLPEVAVYAVAWVLVAAGAARLDGEDDEADDGLSLTATLVTARPPTERRTRPRPVERDRDADRVVDRDRVLAKRAQVEDGDYFAVLGLHRDASAHEVARAFERLKREFALERYAEPLQQELADALGEISDVLDEAHRVLADDGLRKSYRDHLPTAS
jgi:hypothetical protein